MQPLLGETDEYIVRYVKRGRQKRVCQKIEKEKLHQKLISQFDVDHALTFDCFFFFFIDRKIHHQFFLSSLSTNPALKMKFAGNFLFFFSLNFPFHVILWSTSNALYYVKKNSSLIIKCPSNVHLFFIQSFDEHSNSSLSLFNSSVLQKSPFRKTSSRWSKRSTMGEQWF